MQLKLRTRGFSLVEVLVALLVISIGLLGIAKMQALALANTNGGRLRALASIEAASLAASMQTERNYWGNLTNPLTITIAGAAPSNSNGNAVITSQSDSTFAGTVSCPASAAASTASMSPCTVPGTLCVSTTTPCTAHQMAVYDLQQWAGRLQEIMGPSSFASVACTVTAGNPVSCQITINWAEQTVNSNAAETSAMAIPSYTLFVNP
jgi:type IV pilus assembly protein PilV